jgi:serine kinase of HPr protein (carbohydrate metabolism regulator)
MPFSGNTEMRFIINRHAKTVMSNPVMKQHKIHGCFSALRLGGRPPGTLFSGPYGIGTSSKAIENLPSSEQCPPSY